jgi:DNA-nicking Smr family endonuclease
MGVLRHQVPLWLRQPPLGQAVLQVSEAHLKHGGSGAYYVYLRRR